MIENVATATPVEIDTELAAHWQEVYRLRAQAVSAWSNVVFYTSEVLRLRGVLSRWGKATDRQVREFLAEHAEISESAEMKVQAYVEDWVIRPAERAWEANLKVLDLEERADTIVATEINMLDEEWIRRGRWNRAFLVTNGNGHVHRSMHCSTCRPTTEFYWVTEYSDHSEAEIVEAAGWRACTKCYPSAPVLPKAESNTKMFTPDERERQAAREEREAKRAQREAEKIEVPVWDGFSGPHTKTFKTTRAATNFIAGHLSSLCWYGTEHPSADGWISDIVVVREALTRKGVEYNYETMLANVRKKVTREGGQPKY